MRVAAQSSRRASGNDTISICRVGHEVGQRGAIPRHSARRSEGRRRPRSVRAATTPGAMAQSAAQASRRASGIDT